jgi:hypothetical protein
VQLPRSETNEEALRAVADGVEESRLPRVPGRGGAVVRRYVEM